jgi:hypothetical protein
MNWFKENWFKILLGILLCVITYQISTYLNRMAWSYAYAERGQCLERIYARGNNDPFDSKANCYDIISQFTLR